MKAEEIMSRNVQCVSPDASLVEAAVMMRDLDVGALPICDHDRLAGMITDRDIVIRAVAENKNNGDAHVRDAMSEGIVFGYADQDVEEIAQLMEDRQIRRMPLIDRQKRLVGFVALADLARNSDTDLTGEVTQAVSRPT